MAPAESRSSTAGRSDRYWEAELWLSTSYLIDTKRFPGAGCTWGVGGNGSCTDSIVSRRSPSENGWPSFCSIGSDCCVPVVVVTAPCAGTDVVGSEAVLAGRESLQAVTTATAVKAPETRRGRFHTRCWLRCRVVVGCR